MMILQHAHSDARPSPLPEGIRVLVAGYQCHEGYATSLQDRLQPGDQLRLVRQPDNPYDRNAVRVELVYWLA